MSTPMLDSREVKQLCFETLEHFVAERLFLQFKLAKMTALIAGDSIKPFLGHFQFIGAENLEPWLKVRHDQACQL